MPLESCPGGHGASKSSRDPKTVDYSPRTRPEKPEIMSFDDALESCTGGHGASKSSRGPKTVDFSPRKRPKMSEIMSFEDATRVVSRVSRGIEILWGPKNCGLDHKNGQKCPKSPVLTMPLGSYTGVTGHRNPPGSQKPWNVSQENGQKCPKS